MNYQDCRIVFMGTPEFAVASLNKLYEDGCTIVGVITAPDKPAGRGMELQQSAVKKYAVEKGLPILQPEKLKDPAFLQTLQSLHADVQVVVAFRMLPEVVWNMPPMGTVNVHGSLLPQYRGAAPINWAIIHGEGYTGVTTFKLKHEIDTGDILLADRIWIGENETAGELHDRMKEIGAALLLETIKGIAADTIKETPQKNIESLSTDAIKQAPKIFTETCKINWNATCNEIHNLIKGLSPYPTAFTDFEGKKLKIFSAKKEEGASSITPGQFDTDKKNYLRFACADGYINVTDLQLEGKKRMSIQEFLRGYRFS